MYLEVSFTSKINFKKLDLDLQKLGKKLKMGVSTHSETNLQKNIVQEKPPKNSNNSSIPSSTEIINPKPRKNQSLRE
jgi:hypothetical protein